MWVEVVGTVVVQNIQLAAGRACAHWRSQRYVSCENTAAKYRRRQKALQLNCIFCTTSVQPHPSSTDSCPKGLAAALVRVGTYRCIEICYFTDIQFSAGDEE